MTQNFLRLKRRQTVFVAVSVILLAILAAVSAASVYVIIAKLTTESVAYGPAFLIGAAASLITAAVLLPILMPTNKRAAKRIDESFDMHEGVRTMLEFSQSEGDMVELQRTSTERALSEASSSGLLSKKLLYLLVVPVLSVALLVAAVLVPAREPEVPSGGGGGDDIPVFELTDWHIAAIRAIIEDVRASGLDEVGKSEVTSALEKLISDLGYVDTVPEMKETVIGAMVKIDKTALKLNTFVPFVKELAASSSAVAKKYAEALGSLSDPISENKYQELIASIGYSEIKSSALALADALSAALDKSGAVPGDALYSAVADFGEKLSALAAGAEGMSEDEAKAALALTLDGAAESISAVMSAQYVNRSVCNDANTRLMNIFGISRDELPEELKYSDGTESGTVGGDYTEKDDEVITDGGKGSGEVIYGSDDCVLDTEKDEHVPYGEILARYDAIKAGELDERTLSDELREFIEKYFSDLYYSEEDKK